MKALHETSSGGIQYFDNFDHKWFVENFVFPKMGGFFSSKPRRFAYSSDDEIHTNYPYAAWKFVNDNQGPITVVFNKETPESHELSSSTPVPAREMINFLQALLDSNQVRKIGALRMESVNYTYDSEIYEVQKLLAPIIANSQMAEYRYYGYSNRPNNVEAFDAIAKAVLTSGRDFRFDMINCARGADQSFFKDRYAQLKDAHVKSSPSSSAVDRIISRGKKSLDPKSADITDSSEKPSPGRG